MAIIAACIFIACVTALKFRDKWTYEGEPEKSRKGSDSLVSSQEAAH